MSAETMFDLQINTLIGMTEERGNAWHRRDDLRKLPDGTVLEDNHYPRFIPVEDVNRRLFFWHPVEATAAFLVPCELDDERLAFITDEGQPVRVVTSQAGRHGLLRSDNDYDLGVFKTAKHHPYQVSLIYEAERLTGTELGVSSAGLLAKGGKAWVEFSMPETLHDDKSGFAYRPNLLKADSMDGSMAQTTAATINATVCDNTMTWNLLEAERSGRLFRRKHTAGFDDLQDEREALGILERVDEAFVSELHAMIEQSVNAVQVEKVLDILMPLPEDKDKKGRVTAVENVRDLWMDLYVNDPMCSPWKGTAFGVLQTDNTYRHWYSGIQKGSSRSERNTYQAIKGDQRKSDRKVIAALEAVLG